MQQPLIIMIAQMVSPLIARRLMGILSRMVESELDCVTVMPGKAENGQRIQAD
jgi:hypothetical protein